MGDLYDQHTSALLETLERLNLYNSLLDQLERAAGIALGNFGAPTQLYMSPQDYKRMIYNIPCPPTEENLKEEFNRCVDWNTRDILPAALDYRDLRGIVSDSSYSKFIFLETLRKLDLGPNDYLYVSSWTSDAEL